MVPMRSSRGLLAGGKKKKRELARLPAGGWVADQCTMVSPDEQARKKKKKTSARPFSPTKRWSEAAPPLAMGPLAFFLSPIKTPGWDVEMGSIQSGGSAEKAEEPQRTSLTGVCRNEDGVKGLRLCV